MISGQLLQNISHTFIKLKTIYYAQGAALIYAFYLSYASLQIEFTIFQMQRTAMLQIFYILALASTTM